jgi:hypothetical protein
MEPPQQAGQYLICNILYLMISAFVIVSELILHRHVQQYIYCTRVTNWS